MNPHKFSAIAHRDKTASGVATDLTEDVIRRAGLAAKLVDVKVCAIDATWSGLKFVRRLSDRASRK
jgi:Tfp pilus assembly PilM family ATPase